MRIHDLRKMTDAQSPINHLPIPSGPSLKYIFWISLNNYFNARAYMVIVLLESLATLAAVMMALASSQVEQLLITMEHFINFTIPFG